jgi:hypothetical protein
MSKCDYCGTTIIFGGKKDANGRFCNQKCQARGGLLTLSRNIPETIVQEQVWKTHQGLCPNCHGTGPVDVHVSHKVWSAVFLTSWSSTPKLSCRRCAIRNQLGNAAFSLLLGWWGIPWGVLLTPIQVGRNLYAIACPPGTSMPSPQLEKIIRMTLATQTVKQQQAQAAAAAGKTS